MQFAADTSPDGTTRRAATRRPGRPLRAPCTRLRGDLPGGSLAQRLQLQYLDHPHWSYQLHYDNLAAWARADPSLGRLPSYSTVKRYMQAHGWLRKPGPRLSQRPGEVHTETRRQGPRDPQLRSHPRRGTLASRLPLWIRRRCSLRKASGAPRWRWASSTTTPDSAATSSGISRRLPKTWCTDSPRRSKNMAAACPLDR